MTRDIEDLLEIWNTQDVCYERPEKCVMEVLLLVVSFRRYKAFVNTAIRATIIRAKSVSILKILINEMSLIAIMGRMLAADFVDLD